MKPGDVGWVSIDDAVARADEARQVREARIPLYACRAAEGLELFTGRVPSAPLEGRPLHGSVTARPCPVAALEAWASLG